MERAAALGTLGFNSDSAAAFMIRSPVKPYSTPALHAPPKGGATDPDALCSRTMTVSPRIFGAVEAGGTKFVVAVGNERGDTLPQERFPPPDPGSTLATTADFLRRCRSFGSLAAIGVGSFGPVELDKSSPRYGFIT